MVTFFNVSDRHLVNTRLRHMVANQAEQLAGRDQMIALQARQIDTLSSLNSTQSKQIELQSAHIKALHEFVRRLAGDRDEFADLIPMLG